MTPPVPTPAELPATSDGAALLAAIVAHPDEDTPRLMYADWLDESGEGARAEFIRVQCELAKHGPPRRKVAANTCVINRGIISFTTNGLNAGTGSLGLEAGERIDLDVSESGVRARSGAGTKKLIHGVMVERREGTFFEGRLDTESVEDPTTPLHARESALLSANRRTWLAGGVCETCRGRGKKLVSESGWTSSGSPGPIRRVPFATSTCEHCFGSGDSGGLLRPGCEVTFVRGWPYRVTVPQMAWLVEEEWGECDACQGDYICGACRVNGRPTRTVPSRWLRSVLTPTIAERGLICEVVPKCRRPAEMQSARFGHGFEWVFIPTMRDDFHAMSAALPLEVFTRLEGGGRYEDENVPAIYAVYPTAADATAALGRAFCAWGRG
jgi:uncharacterized protein (TIGR02996 family)